MTSVRCLFLLTFLPAHWLALPSQAATATPAASAISFNRDIRPILSDKCFFCHGPDKNQRKADLRLDVRDAALEANAIVPGKPADSSLVERIFSEDPEERMPPPESHKKLSASEKELFKRWISEGAEYQGHWAYVLLTKPETPAGSNAIDALVGRRLKTLGVQPSPKADRRTLIRRLSQDIVGLPPKPEEVDAFVADPAPDAYRRLVDRLLASPQYGERMAIGWLDVVRYADTIGYHSDTPRNVWPFRDYVIRAFNNNKPFDRFTVEQLAGDLLPDAGLEQKVASCFNRLLLSTEEGGAQAKDYEARMVGDRVRAVGSVWLGQTVGCCQCHDHKFDPLKTRDFYSLGAFFADIQEPIIGRREEGMHVPNEQQVAEIARLKGEVDRAQQALAADPPELAAAQQDWEKTVLAESALASQWIVLHPEKVSGEKGSQFKIDSDQSILASGKLNGGGDTYKVVVKTKPLEFTGFRLEALSQPQLPAQGPGRAPGGDFVLTEFSVTQVDKPLKLTRALASYEQVGHPAAATIDGKSDKSSGWAIGGMQGTDQVISFEVEQPNSEAAAKSQDPLDATPQTGKTAAPADKLGDLLDKPTETPKISVDAANKPAAPEEITLVFTLRQQAGGDKTLGRFRLAATTQPRPIHPAAVVVPPADILAIVNVESATRTAAQAKMLHDYFRLRAPLLVPLRQHLDSVKQALTVYETSLPKCLVSTAGAPRTVRILPRGNWQDESGEIVRPALPQYLLVSLGKAVEPATAAGSAASSAGAVAVAEPGKNDPSASPAAAAPASPRLTRLDLAQWLVSRDNPLTARVFVNRLWKQFFGTGLCATLDDLGSQGEWPQNPELIDWLACEFMDSGWDVKHMVRVIVSSRTYQQVSTGSPDLLAKDPDNRWLARQSRFRLDAELIRDNALAVSGLLVSKIGGPSVKPYQPDGYWENLNFPTRKYEADSGENEYRRGLYTWWQRSFLHPSMLAFDAPTREECAADRTRSNIPQQALVLLNDPTYVEAARALAARIVAEGGSDPNARIAWAWRQALQRAPRAEELATVRALVEKQLAVYRDDKTAAAELLKVGQLPAPAGCDPAELAAWTNVARVLLNLHETVTRN